MAQGQRTVTDEEIMREMRVSRSPAFTTAELAERFDMSTEGIRNRLKKLRDEDQIKSKQPGSRTVIWWVE